MDARPEPAGTSADAGATASPLTPEAREALRHKVAELSTVSKDVEMLTRQLAGASNISQVGMLKERIDILSASQRVLVLDIANSCVVPPLQQKFFQLDRQLESVRQQVNDARQMDELDKLKAQIDPLVTAWAEAFQELVMGSLKGP